MSTAGPINKSRQQRLEATFTKQSVGEQVTARLIGLLEQGVIPWKSPFFSKVGIPRNFATGKAYRGVNVFLLGSLRYTSPYFLTFIQAKELGGHVRKGERGGMVVKYGSYDKRAEGESPAPNEEQRRYLKAYTVFNASQIDGIDFPPLEALPEIVPSERCRLAREIVAAMPNAPEIKHGVAIPHYHPGSDTVHMPEKGYFDSEEAYCGTLFHELAHATGHASRLARKSLLENKGIETHGDDRKVYAEEELVAEMTASFLNVHAGILEAEIENAAAYLQGWIAALKSKDARGWIMKAASEAQKAADYILNVQPEPSSAPKHVFLPRRFSSWRSRIAWCSLDGSCPGFWHS